MGDFHQADYIKMIKYLNEIKVICEREAKKNKEACGFWINEEKNAQKIIECENIAQFKEFSFRIDSRKFLECLEKKPVLIYHSHLHGSRFASMEDMRQSNALLIPYLIYSIKEKNFFMHIPDDIDLNENLIKINDAIMCNLVEV